MSENPETENQEILKKGSSFFSPKIFLIGLPLFAIQLVAVYFITANILLSKVEERKPESEGKATFEKKDTIPDYEAGKHIFSIEDVIVNPAGTDGKRLLLASIGFDIASEEEKKILESKEIIIKDLIISTLSSKRLDQLSYSPYKDTLKQEISTRMKDLIPGVQLNNVYLSKYIIQ